MARAPYQVLIFLYRYKTNGDQEVAIFRRADNNAWQAVSGGGEQGETALESAQREVWEETGIRGNNAYSQLNSTGRIPAAQFHDHLSWGADVTEIPEYSFGLNAQSCEVILSAEHTEMAWVSVDQAMQRLAFESNRKALRELAANL